MIQWDCFLRISFHVLCFSCACGLQPLKASQMGRGLGGREGVEGYGKKHGVCYGLLYGLPYELPYGLPVVNSLKHGSSLLQTYAKKCYNNRWYLRLSSVLLVALRSNFLSKPECPMNLTFKQLSYERSILLRAEACSSMCRLSDSVSLFSKPCLFAMIEESSHVRYVNYVITTKF